MRPTEQQNALPRVRTTCEHGLPKLIAAERWLRLGESATAGTDPAVAGGFSFVKGQLVLLFFAFGVYRALPVARLGDKGVRDKALAMFSNDQRTAVEALIKRAEDGEWKDKAQAAWAQHQRDQHTYEMGF